MQLELDPTERKIVLFALKTIKDIIQEPKAGYNIRQSYKSLVAKLKRDDSLSDEIRESL